MWTFTAVFIVLTAGHRAEEYVNNLEGRLSAICPDNQAVSRISSFYSPTYNDRQWEIECKAFETTEDCSWTGFHNLYETDLNFNCPANHVITGIFSEFNIHYGGRRWNFRCCSAPKFITFDCQDSQKVNYWNENFNWTVPGGNFLTGVHAQNKNSNGDHRWSFSYCRGTTEDLPIVSSQILAANKQIQSELTEGDIAVQMTRNAINCDNCKWPKTDGQNVEVPFDMRGFSRTEKSVIETAMEGIHLSTCIRFVESKRATDLIRIVKDQGCWSYVGRIGGAQPLSIGLGCAYNGIVQHELAHALGFLHEQSRSDRDIYVKINYENIRSGYENNFHKYETNNLDAPYDYGSVMHYGPKDFTNNGQDTITPLTPSAQIGQRLGLSENDFLQINKFYGCDDYYLHENGNWDNKLEGTLTRQCPSGQAVSSITSEYNDETRDRLWSFSCKAFRENSVCHWTNYVNDFTQDIDFTCGQNEVIAGAYSEHSDTQEDRKWKFYCCGATDFVTVNCQDDLLVNYWQEYFSWLVPSSNFLTGVKSSFDDSTRDRRWSFSYCQGETTPAP